MCRALLRGFLLAALLFVLLFAAINVFMQEYLDTSDFLYRAEQKDIAALQRYIDKTQLSTDDTSAIGDWVHQRGIDHITISRNRKLLYDSSYSDSIVLTDADSDDLHVNWQYFHTVTFADGDADVYIYAHYETHLYVLLYAGAIALCIFVWVSLFGFTLRREVRYIRALSSAVTQIEHGVLTETIPAGDADELGSLARGLDQMRLALIHKEQQAQQLKEAQDKLVLGMAHDLRTPLTALTSFLELAQKHPDSPGLYIDKAYQKTVQIRELSNQLFDFFLISSAHTMHLEAAEDAEYALGEYLSELCFLLESEGFAVDISHLTWQHVHIRLCLDYAGRIIDNLLSNIRKYADPSCPIALLSAYTDDAIEITVSNRILRPNRFVPGTGIGLQNIQMMMAQMGGTSHTEIGEEDYQITLHFPVT